MHRFAHGKYSSVSWYLDRLFCDQFIQQTNAAQRGRAVAVNRTEQAVRLKIEDKGKKTLHECSAIVLISGKYCMRTTM